MKVNVEEALRIAKEDSLPVPGNRKITAEWTGKWPCLCHGEWLITISGERVELPEEVRTSSMGTYGTYSRWYFETAWNETLEYYQDGLEYEPWVKENAWWLSKLDLSESETKALYEAVSEQDWRHESCGGCI